MRIAAPIALCAVLALGLTGCFANPLDQLTEGISEGIVEGVVEGATGVDVDVSGDGTSASLPSGWPAEVPTPSGRIVGSFGADNAYTATFELAGEAAGEAGRDALLAAGFELTSEAEFGGLKTVVLENATLSVTYAWGDSGQGEIVAIMTVVPRDI